MTIPRRRRLRSPTRRAFGGEVFLWDAESLRPILQAPSGVAPAPALPFTSVDGQAESVYSLAMAGHTVASGANDGLVRVFDARSGALVATLRGHTDNVRALQLDASGRLCLSGAREPRAHPSPRARACASAVG